MCYGKIKYVIYVISTQPELRLTPEKNALFSSLIWVNIHEFQYFYHWIALSAENMRGTAFWLKLCHMGDFSFTMKISSLICLCLRVCKYCSCKGDHCHDSQRSVNKISQNYYDLYTRAVALCVCVCVCLWDEREIVCVWCSEAPFHFELTSMLMHQSLQNARYSSLLLIVTHLCSELYWGLNKVIWNLLDINWT